MSKQPRTYSTKRLELVAATLEHINAELLEPNLLSQLLNAEVTPEWPPGEYDKNAQEYFRDLLIKDEDNLIGWLSWYVIKKSTDNDPAVLIAAGGYTGLPDESGIIEIGYSVVPSHQRKGYATELVEALVSIAIKDPRVKKIIARTTIANEGSCSVLKRAGFNTTGLPDSKNNILYEKNIN